MVTGLPRRQRLSGRALHWEACQCALNKSLVLEDDLVFVRRGPMQGHASGLSSSDVASMTRNLAQCFFLSVEPPQRVSGSDAHQLVTLHVQ